MLSLEPTANVEWNPKWHVHLLDELYRYPPDACIVSCIPSKVAPQSGAVYLNVIVCGLLYVLTLLSL